MNTLATRTFSIANLRQTGAAAAVDIIAAPGAGKRIFVRQIIFGSVSAACNAQITNGADAAGTRILDQTFVADGGIVLDYQNEPFACAADTALKLTTSAGNCRVNVLYWVQ